MHFKDIQGKTQAKEFLINQVKRDRVSHAQIFIGKEGSGGLAMALAFASYILCKNKQDGDSCGTCSACTKSHKWVHPDLHFAFPVVKYGDLKRESTTSEQWLPQWREILAENPHMSMKTWLEHIKADKSQPNINVKECNDIKHKLGLMAYESDAKILIMWLPEYLEKEGNRLLKLIEEPTDNTYIFLVAEQQDRILQTILSRCQIVLIPPYKPEEITHHLVTHCDAVPRQAEQIAHLVDGDLNHAIAICTGDETDYSDTLISWLRTAYKSDPLEINAWINSIAEMTKDDQKNFLSYGLHYFREYLYWMMTGENQVALTEKEKGIAQNMTKTIDVAKAEKICDIFNDGIYYIQRNANLKIMLYADTLLIGKILHNQS
jgi:DNA polymerase III subunit delta'